MTSHVIAYRSTELFFCTHTFNFNCFFDIFNCVFTQIRCLSRLLQHDHIILTLQWRHWACIQCAAVPFYLSHRLVRVCEIKFSYMSKNNGNPDLVCEKIIYDPIKDSNSLGIRPVWAESLPSAWRNRKYFNIYTRAHQCELVCSRLIKSSVSPVAVIALYSYTSVLLLYFLLLPLCGHNHETSLPFV